VGAAPAADPPAPPAPGGSRAERWADLTDQPDPSGNGHGHGDGRPAVPDGDGADWSGWWEPSPGDLAPGDPLSPLAARPPLSERAQPLSARVQPPPSGTPEPHLGASATPEPRPLVPDDPPPAPVAVGEAAEPLLARRVPQAHLAPELRRNGRGAAAADPEGPLPDAAEARAALSRYQASRQAARAVVDDGRTAQDGRAGPEGPPANGGWS
jgi:hypothetical protein